MKILLTGAGGTVATALSDYLKKPGHEIIAWDRSVTPIDKYFEMENFVRAVQPDALYHLATASNPTGRDNESWLVNYDWSSELAWICRILDIQFIYTSSVMVFSDSARGPFTPDSVPDAPAGYGFEKRRAEERIPYQHPGAKIARLGWQIGDAPGSNNMIDYLEKQMAQNGKIVASRQWLPACSFLPDTAKALSDLLKFEPGLYMIDANTRWNFYEICNALNQLHGGKWQIEPNDDFVYDQRMIDPRLKVPPLDVRLKEL